MYTLLTGLLFTCLSFSFLGQESETNIDFFKEMKSMLPNSLQQGEGNTTRLETGVKKSDGITPKAPVVLMNEDFTDGIPEEWTVLQETTNDVIGWLYSEAYTDEPQARSLTYDNDFNPTPGENWMITDQISIDEADFEMILNFYGRSWGGPDETFSVLVSTTGNAPADFTDEIETFTLIEEWTIRATVFGGQPVFTNLDDYIGEDIYLAFKHVGEGGDVLIPSVRVGRKRENDLAIGAYYVGEYTHFPLHLNYTPEQIARIDNVGKLTQSNVRLRSDVGDFSLVSEAVTLEENEDVVHDVTGFTPDAIGVNELMLTATQDQEDDDPSDNMVSWQLNTTENIVGRDFGTENIQFSYGLENDWFYLANTFVFNKQTAATGMQFSPGTNGDGSISSAGKSVVMELYNDADELLASSDPYVIETEDVGGLVEIPFTDVAILDATETYYASVYYPNGGYVFQTDGLPFADNSVSFVEGDTDWQNSGSVGIIRLKAEDICDHTIIETNEVIIDATCNGAVDGSIELDPADGAEPYDYTWSHDVELNANLADNLAAGEYTVEITDANECVKLDTFIVNEPGPIDATTTPTNTSGCGVEDGQIFIDFAAAGDYSIEWTGPASSVDPVEIVNEAEYTITDLPSGEYVVTVFTDDNCSTLNVEILEDGAAEISLLDSQAESCLDANDGFIEIQSGDDLTGYNFEWTKDGAVIADEDGLMIDGIGGGSYSVRGTDGACNTNTVSVTLDDGEMLDLDLVLTAAISCIGQEDAVLTVTFANLTEDMTDYDFTWNDGTDNLAETSNEITGLGAGTYNVVANGLCTSSNPSITVDPADGLLDLSIVIDEPIECNEEEGTISAFSEADLSGYTFEWFDVNEGAVIDGETGTTITVGAGNYLVDGVGDCDTETGSVTLSQPDAIIITGEITSGEEEGTITTSGFGGTGGFDITWVGPNDFASTEADVTITESGVYTVTYTDENGCSESMEFTSTVSVETFEANNIKVYPNPAKTSINFDVTDAGANNIYVYDVTGKSVANLDAANNSLVELNVQNLENGMYLYRITKQDGTILVSSKFTVAR